MSASYRYDGDDAPPCISERFVLPGPGGGLEVVSECPPGGGLRGLGIVCHPHPLYGGNLNNKVVHVLARTFNEHGLGALRFNFRGVGASEGRYDGGDGETDDLAAVLDWARARCAGRPLWLGGFSFGAYVALRAAAAWPLDTLITVAPPVNVYEVTGRVPPDCRWVLAHGVNDEVVPLQALERWLHALERQPDATIYVEGASHMFDGRLTALRRALREQLNRGE